MTTSEQPAQERILETSYELFSRRGVRAVGIDQIIELSGVAKATFYRHFPSKDDLVTAFLQRREKLWTRDWVEGEARRRGRSPESRLLAIFDLFDEWFRRKDFEGCSFINVLLEMGLDHPAGRASVKHLENIRDIVRTLAEEANIKDPRSFSHSWHILMKGSIVAAGEGDIDAARRAKELGRLLIGKHQKPRTSRSLP